MKVHSSQEDTKVTQGYEGITPGGFADKIQKYIK